MEGRVVEQQESEVSSNSITDAPSGAADDGRKIKEESVDVDPSIAANIEDAGLEEGEISQHDDLNDEGEKKPKKITLAALQLTMPSKRKGDSSKDRPFAPPGKVRKVKKEIIPGQVIDTRATQPYSRSDVQSLKYVRTLIKEAEEATSKDDERSLHHLFHLLRQQIHEIEFMSNLSGDLVTQSRLLDDNALAKIVGKVGVDYPFDLVADTKALHDRWSKGDFDAFLLRGIELKSRTQGGKTTKSRNLDKNYPYKVSPNFIGEGPLVNGQWWPHQICAIRDGAHGAIEAGIFGERGKGALSIVVGSSGYANEDDGDIIKYCGTSGSLGTPTENTKLMIESQNRQTPVRVIRSGASNAKKHSVYQPIVGLRYDGLYQVTGNTLMDQGTAMYQFRLERLPGQDPIRCRGVEIRPTPEESHVHSRIREALGYSN